MEKHSTFNKLPLVVLALLLVANSSSVFIPEDKFTQKELTEHCFLNGMIANTLKLTYNQEEMIEKYRNHKFEKYAIFEQKYKSMKEAKYDVLKYLKIQELAVSQRIDQIFEEKGYEAEVWHVISNVVYKEGKILVGFFYFDKCQDELYLHILEKKIQSDEIIDAGLASITGYQYSDFGFKIEVPVENLNTNVILSEEQKRLLEDEIHYAMSKVAEVRHINPHNPHSEKNFETMVRSQNSDTLQVPAIVVAYAAAAATKAFAKLWTQVTKFFKTSVKSTFINTIKREGFTKYHLKSTIQRQFGIPDTKLSTYLSYLTRRLTAQKPKHQADIRAALDIVEFVPENQWAVTDTNVDVQDSSHDKFFSIMYNRENSLGKLNFMIIDTEARFTLSSNLDVYKESKSVLGGAFASEQYKIKMVPRSVSDDDIKAMRLFNLMIIFKLYDDELNQGGQAFPKI